MPLDLSALAASHRHAMEPVRGSPRRRAEPAGVGWHTVRLSPCSRLCSNVVQWASTCPSLPAARCCSHPPPVGIPFGLACAVPATTNVSSFPSMCSPTHPPTHPTCSSTPPGTPASAPTPARPSSCRSGRPATTTPGESWLQRHREQACRWVGMEVTGSGRPCSNYDPWLAHTPLHHHHHPSANTCPLSVSPTLWAPLTPTETTSSPPHNSGIRPLALSPPSPHTCVYVLAHSPTPSSPTGTTSSSLGRRCRAPPPR